MRSHFLDIQTSHRCSVFDPSEPGSVRSADLLHKLLPPAHAPELHGLCTKFVVDRPSPDLPNEFFRQEVFPSQPFRFLSLKILCPQEVLEMQEFSTFLSAFLHISGFDFLILQFQLRILLKHVQCPHYIPAYLLPDHFSDLL